MIRTHVFSYNLTENPKDKESKVSIEVCDLWTETANNTVFELPTLKFLKFMDDLCWDAADGSSTCANEVLRLQNDAKLEMHRTRVAECDLSFPIIVMGDEATLTVVQVCDGMHRVAKAVTNNISTIKARFLTLEQHDACVEMFKKRNENKK